MIPTETINMFVINPVKYAYENLVFPDVTISSVCSSSNHSTNLCPQFLSSSSGNQYGPEWKSALYRLSSNNEIVEWYTRMVVSQLFDDLSSSSLCL